MGVKRFRLTKGAKVLILVLIIGIVVGGIAIGLKTGVVKNDIYTDESGNVINTTKTSEDTINLSLDEWIGWKSIIDANGGLQTKDGSIYDQLGIKVNISVINDATQSSNALISGNLDATGYTINRTAFLSQKFKESGIDVVMPFITNFSNGGDGIIAKSNITSVDDLVNAKIGVPQFSEAHSLVVWFVNQSDLSQSEQKKIIDNLIFFETPDEAAKAFFAGQIDVAATWEPYLTQAKNMSDAHILFSTASSSSLIMDGILFNADFAENNPKVVSAFINGALQASNMYDTELNTIKKVMPMFATASNQDIKDNCAAAKLTTYADNLKLFNGAAKVIYTDMCDVWSSIGESVNKGLINTLFDSKYISALAGQYDVNDYTSVDTNVIVSDDNKQEIIDADALLKKTTTVQFIYNTARFLDSSDATSKLDEFIEIAKILDGSIIQVEGNIAVSANHQHGITLSENRAETVKQYFILNGIDPNRIVTVGNGDTKPIAPNDTEAHKQLNRRTDISFKCIE